jgi:predicted solute-binding protein
MSVLFFSRHAFDAMHAPRTLRVTSETASSVRLLYLLMGSHFGFDRLPHLAETGQAADGELLIGDRALIRGQAGQKGDGYTHVTDLSQLWLSLKGRPFVFARWVVNKNASPVVKDALVRWLETFKANESTLVEMAVVPSARVLGLPEDVVRRYFSVIRRCLDEEDLQGQQLFFEAMEKIGSRPLF